MLSSVNQSEKKILVADSGSTKTRWQLIEIDQTLSRPFDTRGYNPYHWTEEDLVKAIKDEVPDFDGVGDVYFYGSGCSTPSMADVMRRALKARFDHSQIHIEHDLIGSARALFGKDPGLVMILGTGSNTGIYDGRDIVENLPSLGYILGDEGGGASLGKKLLSQVLSGEAPREVISLTEDKVEFSRELVLELLYRGKLPNRFLAGYSKFIASNIDMPYFQDLVRDEFEILFTKSVSRYKNHKNFSLGATGSVANAFGELLQSVARKFGFDGIKVLQDPLPALVNYHRERLRG